MRLWLTWGTFTLVKKCVVPKASPTARTWYVQVAGDELERTAGVGEEEHYRP